MSHCCLGFGWYLLLAWVQAVSYSSFHIISNSPSHYPNRTHNDEVYSSRDQIGVVPWRQVILDKFHNGHAVWLDWWINSQKHSRWFKIFFRSFLQLLQIRIWFLASGTHQLGLEFQFQLDDVFDSNTPLRVQGSMCNQSHCWGFLWSLLWFWWDFHSRTLLLWWWMLVMRCWQDCRQLFHQAKYTKRFQYTNY